MTQEAKVLLGIGIATILILIGGVFYLSTSNPQVTPSGTVDRKVLVAGKNTVGSPTAKVTLVEFADFQCPACGAFYPDMKKILSEYKGKIHYVYRHFPLPSHRNAMRAAYASQAAGAQGKFWEMHDLLFEKQSAWSETADPLPVFIEYAKQLELDTEAFASAVSENTGAAVVQKDLRDGSKAGVNATPTVFVNGKKVEGATSIADLTNKVRQAIQEALSSR